MMWNWGYGSWWMTVAMIVFWVGVFALLVWAVRTNGRRSHRGDRRSSIDLLEERYARGDIDEDEFHRRRRVLEDTRDDDRRPSAG